MTEIFAEPEVDIGIVDALPVLAKLTGAAVLVGVCYEADAFARAFFGVGKAAVGWIPFGGSLISAGLDTIEQAITSYLGAAEAELDAELGADMHALAQIGDRLLAAMAQLGLLETVIAERVEQALAHAATATVETVVRDARTVVERKTVDVIRDVEHVGGATASAAVGILAGRVGALEHDVEHILEPTVEQLRDRTRAIEDQLTRDYAWLRQHEQALSATAEASAVAVALESLGIGWARCAGVGAVGSALCGLGPALIEGLLAGLIDIGILFDLCAITSLLTDIAESGPVQDGISTLVGGIDALVSCQDLTAATALPQTFYAAPGAETAMAAPGQLV